MSHLGVGTEPSSPSGQAHGEALSARVSPGSASPAQGGTARPCSQLQSHFPAVRTVQPPGVSEPSLGGAPGALLPSLPARIARRETSVWELGWEGGSLSLNPPQSGNWTIQDRGKSLLSPCPGRRFGSSASLCPARGQCWIRGRAPHSLRSPGSLWEWPHLWLTQEQEMSFSQLLPLAAGTLSLRLSWS